MIAYTNLVRCKNSRLLMKWLSCTLACLVLVCCRAADSGDTGAFEVVADGDFRVEVRRLVEPVEIISLDDVFQSELYRPVSMSTSASGLICIADQGGHRVLVVNEDFDVVADFGREGKGPGEFTNLIGCTVGENDHVFALEPDRLSQFELSGELIETFRPASGLVGIVPLSSNVFGNGEVLTASADFRAVTIRSAITGKSRVFDLPGPPVPCGENDLRNSANFVEAFIGSLVIGPPMSTVSSNGRHIVLAREFACSKTEDTNYSLVARIDLETERAEVHPLVVYDEFRPWSPPLNTSNRASPKIVLRSPATDGGRDYVLHVSRRRVEDFYLMPLDVWEADRGEPVRLYVAVRQDAVERIALHLMVSTLSGDLLIIDRTNSLLLRLAAADLTAALENY